MTLLRQLKTHLKLRFPKLAQRVRSTLPRYRKKHARWGQKSLKEVFSTIYEENYWGSEESRSGLGSTLEATATMREELPRILSKLGARSMLDAPCGDYHWMRHVDLGDIKYIGGDIVPQLIRKLQEEHADDMRSFIEIDLTTDTLPDVDVLFCRDCLQHLEPRLAIKVIDNFRRSSCKYLFTTSFEKAKFNSDGFTGGMNALNLCLKPFNLPEPINRIHDPAESEAIGRFLGVWTREQVLQAGDVAFNANDLNG